MKNKKTIIKLYDNEGYDYPFIIIREGYLDNFKAHLKRYQSKEGYNLDDFIIFLDRFPWFVEVIYPDEEIFF